MHSRSSTRHLHASARNRAGPCEFWLSRDQCALRRRISADPTNLNQKEIVNFLEENTIENTGVHAQLSFQFKVLFIDTHVFYRHVFLDSDQELAPGISDFGSFNVRAGIGF